MVLTRLVRLEAAEMLKRKTRTSGRRGHVWQLQEAKARFSEVFRLAREQGPQRVTKHGRAAVVGLPAEEYDRLSRPEQPKENLVEFLMKSPLADSRIRFDRQRDYGREIEL